MRYILLFSAFILALAGMALGAWFNSKELMLLAGLPGLLGMSVIMGIYK